MPDANNRTIWRKDVLAWCSYDWANSGYTTLLITVFAVYVQRIVFNESSGSYGAVVWAWTVAASMLAGAVLSPLAGAWADARAGKRLGLAAVTLAGSGSCMAMALLPPDQTWLVITCLLLANICLELSLTFYNGFLPELANENEINGVSAAGMGWGYLGGGIWLLITMLLLGITTSSDSGDGATMLRMCIFLTGVWWLGFTVPTIWILRDRPRPTSGPNQPKNQASVWSDTAETLKQVWMRPTLCLFLIGFLFFNDGVQTVISQSSTFALQELSFSNQELVGLILMVQIVAMPGAFLVGWLADQWGQKTTLLLCLAIWILLVGSAWFIESKQAYWVMAFGIAVVLGGTQAVSRAIMGTLTPAQQEARYFGLFNLSGKATSFMGTFVFGLIVAMTGSSRIAIVNLVVFFIIGLVLVARIDLKRGIAERDA